MLWVSKLRRQSAEFQPRRVWVRSPPDPSHGTTGCGAARTAHALRTRGAGGWAADRCAVLAPLPGCHPAPALRAGRFESSHPDWPAARRAAGEQLPGVTGNTPGPDPGESRFDPWGGCRRRAAMSQGLATVFRTHRGRVRFPCGPSDCSSAWSRERNAHVARLEERLTTNQEAVGSNPTVRMGREAERRGACFTHRTMWVRVPPTQSGVVAWPGQGELGAGSGEQCPASDFLLPAPRSQKGGPDASLRNS
jgi:hypothetical protein